MRSQARCLSDPGMRERAHLIGAELEIIGRHAKGTLVAVRVPISGTAKC